jgi:hypothetical protein
VEFDYQIPGSRFPDRQLGKYLRLKTFAITDAEDTTPSQLVNISSLKQAARLD